MTRAVHVLVGALRQTFMSREEYQELREEDKVWRQMRRPLIMCVATVLWLGVIISAVISLNVVFPAGGDRPFCSKNKKEINSTSIDDQMHASYIREHDATRYFWLVDFIPMAMVFSVSVTYLLAGMAVAYSAPDRHGCIRVVENNCCALRQGGVRCLATLNMSFAIVFVLFALFLGSSVLTLETDCSVTLFWCYEVICWGLVLLSGGTFFSLRRKAAVILDEGEVSDSCMVGMEMLEAPVELPMPEMERRVDEGFKSWMGSSILSSDEEEEPATPGSNESWEEDQESYITPERTRRFSGP